MIGFSEVTPGYAISERRDLRFNRINVFHNGVLDTDLSRDYDQGSSFIMKTFKGSSTKSARITKATVLEHDKKHALIEFEDTVYDRNQVASNGSLHGRRAYFENEAHYLVSGSNPKKHGWLIQHGETFIDRRVAETYISNLK